MGPPIRSPFLLIKAVLSFAPLVPSDTLPPTQPVTFDSSVLAKPPLSLELALLLRALLPVVYLRRISTTCWLTLTALLWLFAENSVSSPWYLSPLTTITAMIDNARAAALMFAT